ncbi:MAG: iron-containing alcohol dehydrogenase family protein [Lachnospiraceae bacterium]|nr:iron-containing alcohol dehydrogenase family protein [Lachnospiraceae bacterium]
MNTSISIPALLKIEKGALSEIGSFLKSNNLNKAVVFFGNGLIDLFGMKVLSSLEENSIEVLSYMELDTVNIEDITDIAFNLPNQTQVVIGIGGGKVIDAAKYTGFLKKIPYISAPTATSNDGFSSATASLLIRGKRQSVPAKMAFGIVADIDAIKSAPRGFLYSGIGDMICKITAIYDWQFEASKGYSQINDVAVMIAKKAVNSLVRTPYTDITDDVFLKELLNSLAMCGIANEIAGSSLPTSGSEHLISHAIDQKAEKPQQHGIQVGIATYIMCLVQEHRVERIRNFLTDTGFFDYVATLNLDVNDYLNAIEYAPNIKPFRHTYLHEEEYRMKAKRFIVEDEILKKIFHE